MSKKIGTSSNDHFHLFLGTFSIWKPGEAQGDRWPQLPAALGTGAAAGHGFQLGGCGGAHELAVSLAQRGSRFHAQHVGLWTLGGNGNGGPNFSWVEVWEN